MSQPILEIKNATVAYHGDITILDDVSLKFAEGQISGIIGPNGAGKSTVLKTLYGFLDPRPGSIHMGSERIDLLAPHLRIRRGVAYVPQHRSVFPDLTVWDNLKLGCWPFRKERLRVERAFEIAYDVFPVLYEKRDELAGGLSGGQQRFLELARALMVEPQVILLDEPTAMIAPKLSQEIYRMISEMPGKGISVVLVDQNVRQCAAVSDQLFVLELGRNKATVSRKDLSTDTGLQDMIGEWLDYRID